MLRENRSRGRPQIISFIESFGTCVACLYRSQFTEYLKGMHYHLWKAKSGNIIMDGFEALPRRSVILFSVVLFFFSMMASGISDSCSIQSSMEMDSKLAEDFENSKLQQPCLQPWKSEGSANWPPKNGILCPRERNSDAEGMETYFTTNDIDRSTTGSLDSPSVGGVFRGSSRRQLQQAPPIVEGQGESFVLLDIKRRINDMQGVLSSWNLTSLGAGPEMHCLWLGVECLGGRVRSLDLSGWNLSGEIGPEVGNLTSLVTLNLSNNRFGGEIPSELGLCRNLTVLDLSGNDLTGPIPSSLGDLQNLTVLSLALNPISGQIPSALGKCESLQLLHLGYTNLSGHLPKELGNCTSLLHLRIYSNPSLTGEIPPLGSLDNLRTLDLYRNNLTGSIPETLGDCRSLKRIRLFENQLNGSIPDPFKRLENLEYLALANNQLTGRLFDFGSLKNLTILYLQNNQLNESIPTSLGGCKKLQVVHLGGNQLTGNITDFLGFLGTLTKLRILNLEQKLRILNLEQNRLSGHFPDSILNCVSLEQLNLRGNQFIWKIPKDIGLLTNLTALRLSQNDLTGEIPSSIGDSCRRLEYLELAQTQLKGQVPSSLGKCSNLVRIDLALNNLTGGIPLELGQLQRLDFLSLSSNKLTGNIPKSLGNCTSLKELWLDTNQFNGSMPPELGSLTNLEGLYLFENNLTGSIPTSIGNCTKLKDLLLGENHPGLNGSLPESLGRLHQLERLHIQRNLNINGDIPWTALSNCSKLSEFVAMRNHLTGTISVDLGEKFPSLSWLDFSKNHLTGGFPQSILNCTKLELLRLYGNNFTGELDVDLSRLPMLRTLHLSTNKFNGTLAKLNLRNSTHLEYLDLSNNSLTGKIPDYADYDSVILPSMRILTFRSNRLEGEIPEWIWRLHALQVLDLSRNNFSGNLPSDWTQLRDLTNSSMQGNKRPPNVSSSLRTVTYEQTLITIKSAYFDTYIFNFFTLIDLSNNALDGPIPAGLEALQGLSAVYLTNNKFTGNIPLGLLNITNLLVLDLSMNLLSGDITTFASMLGPLEYINVSHNSLKGRVDQTRYDAGAWVPNEGICGEIFQSCDSPGAGAAGSDDGTSFSELISIVAFEIGVTIGALLVGGSCLVSRRLRHAWFKLPRKQGDSAFEVKMPPYGGHSSDQERWEGRPRLSGTPSPAGSASPMR